MPPPSSSQTIFLITSVSFPLLLLFPWITFSVYSVSHISSLYVSYFHPPLVTFTSAALNCTEHSSNSLRYHSILLVGLLLFSILYPNPTHSSLLPCSFDPILYLDPSHSSLPAARCLFCPNFRHSWKASTASRPPWIQRCSTCRSFF